MGVAGDGLLIGGIIRARHRRVFLIRPVVHKRTHLHSLHQLRNAANVIAMIVSDQDIIEPSNARLVSGSQDPIGIAPFISRPTCVDQQRLPARTHQQSRLPPLDIDEINLQRLGAWSRGCRARQNYGEDPKENAGTQQATTHSLAPDGVACARLCHAASAMRDRCFSGRPSRAAPADGRKMVAKQRIRISSEAIGRRRHRISIPHFLAATMIPRTTGR